MLRVGRRLGRTIYLQLGMEPSDNDCLVGMMDTVSLAASVVEGYNMLRKSQDDVQQASELAIATPHDSDHTTDD